MDYFFLIIIVIIIGYTTMLIRDFRKNPKP